MTWDEVKCFTGAEITKKTFEPGALVMELMAIERTLVQIAAQLDARSITLDAWEHQTSADVFDRICPEIKENC